jgi:hypothetical protein
MGLDVAAVSKLRPIKRELTQYGALVDGRFNWEPVRTVITFRKEQVEFTDRYWPAGSEGIKPDQPYTYAKSRSFRAYGRYTRWRLLLEEFASANPADRRTARHLFAELRLPKVVGQPVRRHLWAWHRRPAIRDEPLGESLGIIGPIAAGKLARDFAEHDERAEDFPALRAKQQAKDNREWLEIYEYWCGWLTLYREWRKSLELAADDGAISFF